MSFGHFAHSMKEKGRGEEIVFDEKQAKIPPKNMPPFLDFPDVENLKII